MGLLDQVLTAQNLLGPSPPWGGESRFHRSSTLNSPTDQRVRLSQALALLRHRPRAVPQIDHGVPRRVAHLFGARRPTAVVRRIAFVVVAPLDLQASGSLAHVAEEGCERHPARADGNAPTGISGMPANRMATVKHPTPNKIGPRRPTPTAAGVAVYRRSQASALSLQAPARLGASVHETRAQNNQACAAIALADPLVRPIFCRRLPSEFDHRESAVAPTIEGWGISASRQTCHGSSRLTPFRTRSK